MGFDEISAIICFFLLVFSAIWCAFVLPALDATKQHRAFKKIKRDIKKQYRNAGQMYIIINGVEKKIQNGKIKE